MKRIIRTTLCAAVLSLSLAVPQIPASAESSGKSDDIVILYTNDIHCGITDKIGYDGLALYKREMQEEYNNVLLVDAGDAIQGAPTGTFSKGAYITRIMNAVGYDAATLGNHEFDYGISELSLRADELDCGYICSNYYDSTGMCIFEPYKIIEAGEKKIAFVGAVTPETLSKTTPAFFRDDNGEYIYSFGEDGTLYERIQAAVDDANDSGADYVILLAHLGENDITEEWSAPEVVANLTGIDALIDGHSHEVTPGFTVKSKDGKDVVITQTGTKLANIGKMTIAADGTIKTELVDTVPAPDDYPGIAEDSWLEPDGRDGRYADENINTVITLIESEYSSIVDETIGHSEFEMPRTDPDTELIRVKCSDTGIGDLCADAYKNVLGADIGIAYAGTIRASLGAGDITYRDVIAVSPFGNIATSAKVTGQQLLDLLEMGARSYPDGNNSFITGSGIEYTIDESIPSSVVTDDKDVFVGVNGEYRVKDVLINGEPLDLSKKYILGSNDYFLKNGGDGYIFTGKCDIVRENVMADYELLKTYISDNLGGVIPDRYSVPFGDGRVKVISGAAASVEGDTADSALSNNTTAGNPATGTGLQSVAVLILFAAAAAVTKRKIR